MPLASHLLALPRIRHLILIRHLIHLSLLTLPGSPARPRPDLQPDPSTTTPTKELAMRIHPSDILFLTTAALLLLLTAFTLGGLAAHPF